MRYQGWYHCILDSIIIVLLSVAYLIFLSPELPIFAFFVVGNFVFIFENQLDLSLYFKALTLRKEFVDHQIDLMAFWAEEKVGRFLVVFYFCKKMRFLKRVGGVGAVEKNGGGFSEQAVVLGE